MAQTNVIVSYAPARRAAVDARPVDRSERRWSAALAGALLAGGAIFTLGHFVAADGSLRETGFPARPGTPLIEAEPAETMPIAARMGQPRSLIAKPAPLPYLALVRDIAPAPRAAPALRRMAASTPREPLRATLRTPLAAAMPEPVAAAEPAVSTPPELAVDLAAQPTPPPAGGLRRDLEGFLQAQGHELAVADTTGTLVVAEAELADEPAALPDVAILPPVDAGLGDATEAPELAAAVQPGPQPGLAVAPSVAMTGPAVADPIAPPEAIDTPPAQFATAPIPTLTPSAAAPPDPLAIQSYPVAVVNGEPLGAITLRDGSAGEPTIHLGALVGLLRLRMPEAEFARLGGAAAADRFVTLDELRAAGITVQFDARENRLLIDAR